MLFFLPYTIFLLLIRRSLEADINVGTVLFTKADQYKECWSSENVALLTSRMILEDLLPSTTILVIDSNEFVTDLVDYFRLILETVRQETQGKTKHITLMALTDLLGGYLHHAVLPVAKYAYYAGSIDYDSMSTLLNLFDELKLFLRTNGEGWAQPVFQNLESIEIQKLDLQPCKKDKDVCDNIILSEDDVGGEKRSIRCDISIPLPFFDSNTQPSAVALPTKTSPLYSLEANSSSNLIMNFFIRCHKCLQLKNARVEKFETEYSAWIEDQIMPRLKDEKFYTAFGGILRVRTSIRKVGPMQSVEQQVQETDLMQSGRESLVNEHMNRSSMILMAVLITIFVWFILGTLFICYRMRQTRHRDADFNDSDGKTTTTASSLCSSKFFYPERPRTSTKDSTYKERNKGRRHEITIKACKCQDMEDCEPASLRSLGGTSDRLPSITEMSEGSHPTSSSRKHNKNRHVRSTDDSGDTHRRVSDLKLYEDDTDTELEESSPE